LIKNRDYSDVYVPEFYRGRKIEDISSRTGYKIAKNASGEEIKQKPSMNIATLDAKLFTTMFDNTARTDNKYDVRVTNEADISFQKTDANGAMYNGFDIIEIPSQIFFTTKVMRNQTQSQKIISIKFLLLNSVIYIF